MGLKNGTAILEDKLAVSYKNIYTLTIQPSNIVHWYLHKQVENLCPQKFLHTDVYSSFFYSCWNLEASKMPYPHHTSWFKCHYKSIVRKTVYYWHKNRDIDQWNTIKSLEVNSYIYGQLIFDEFTKNTQWGKMVSSVNGVGKTEYPHTEEWN